MQLRLQSKNVHVLRDCKALARTDELNSCLHALCARSIMPDFARPSKHTNGSPIALPFRPRSPRRHGNGRSSEATISTASEWEYSEGYAELAWNLGDMTGGRSNSSGLGEDLIENRGSIIHQLTVLCQSSTCIIVRACLPAWCNCKIYHVHLPGSVDTPSFFACKSPDIRTPISIVWRIEPLKRVNCTSAVVVDRTAVYTESYKKISYNTIFSTYMYV